MIRKTTFILLLVTISLPAQAQVPESDSLALVALYESTDGANWTNIWDLDTPVSGWYGVMVSEGRVTEVHLSENQLTGSIPAELGNLTNLSHLYLHSNQISRSIPAELGSLTNLSGLSLSFNQLTGSIPAELGSLAILSFLQLSSNQLTGSIPAELGNLTNLSYLELGSNQLTRSIPAELGNMINLSHLHLSSNQLTGSIPAELGNLTNLSRLYLNSNQLTGSIPAELGSLANLSWLYLYSNQLTGSIPAELGNLTNLFRLSLGSNQLAGAIPVELGNLANLRLLYLHSNQLNRLPDLRRLTALEGLRVRNNHLTFSDLEPNIRLASSEFTYAPQDSIGIATEQLLSYSGATALAVNVGGTANAYQWAKNGVAIPGATNKTVDLLGVTLAAEGSYTCAITNSLLPELTLHSRPIHVSVSPPAIAVLDFEGMGISAGEALTLSKRVGTLLVQLGRHKVIERGQMKRILQEQDFQSLGCTDEECAVEIGQLIGAQQMLAGSIGKFGTVYTIDLKIIDVETGQVLWTTSYDSEGSLNRLLTEGVAEVVGRIAGMD